MPPAQERIARSPTDDPNRIPPYNQRGVRLAALVGGATNGMIGARGPVVNRSLAPRRSPALRDRVGQHGQVALRRRRRSPSSGRWAVVGFNVSVIVAMLAGGIIAAPVAAWLIRYIPPRPMGVAVAGLLLLTNARELATWGGLASGPWVWAIYAGIIAVVALVVFASRVRALGAASAASEVQLG